MHNFFLTALPCLLLLTFGLSSKTVAGQQKQQGVATSRQSHTAGSESLPRQTVLLGAFWQANGYEWQAGMESSLLFRLSNSSPILLGPQGTFTIKSKFYTALFRRRAYDVTTYCAGIRAVCRIIRIFHFSVNPAIVLGKESSSLILARTASGPILDPAVRETKYFSPQLALGLTAMLPQSRQGLFAGIEAVFRKQAGEILSKGVLVRFCLGAKL